MAKSFFFRPVPFFFALAVFFAGFGGGFFSRSFMTF
jgi:hypothetical protein